MGGCFKFNLLLPLQCRFPQPFPTVGQTGWAPLIFNEKNRKYVVLTENTLTHSSPPPALPFTKSFPDWAVCSFLTMFLLQVRDFLILLGLAYILCHTTLRSVCRSRKYEQQEKKRKKKKGKKTLLVSPLRWVGRELPCQSLCLGERKAGGLTPPGIKLSRGCLPLPLLRLPSQGEHVPGQARTDKSAQQGPCIERRPFKIAYG